jgi:hypothetical protein
VLGPPRVALDSHHREAERVEQPDARIVARRVADDAAVDAEVTQVVDALERRRQQHRVPARERRARRRARQVHVVVEREHLVADDVRLDEREQQSDRAAAAGAQPARGAIRAIAELARRVRDPRARAGVHPPLAVQRVRDSRRRHADGCRDVVDGDPPAAHRRQRYSIPALDRQNDLA